MTRIDIIGAGISGLSTAYYLARAFETERERKIEIHVWEKDATPGGLAGTFTTPDFAVEKFYHHIFKRDRDLQQLIADVGLGEDIVWRPAATGAYYFRQPYRLSSPLDLLRFKPLPFFDRLRLGWMAVHARAVKDWRQLDDISCKEYIHRIAGDTVYRVVWEPLFRGKFGAYADSVSAAWLWSKLVDRGGSRNSQGHELLGYLRGGMGRMFEAIVATLQRNGHHLHFGQSVRRLHGTGERITTIETTEGAFPTDAVIGCAQLPELAEILPEQAATYRQALGSIGFLSNVCLVLTLNQSLSDFYWTNVTEPDAPFIGIIEQTKWADSADFHGKHVAYISAYVSPDDPRLNMDGDALLAQYLPAIRKMFPQFSDSMVEAAVVWTAKYAQPIVTVGYRHLVPEIQSPLRNLFVCTMAQIYPHDRQMSNGVALARKTAEIVRQALQAA
ncbi:probable protoporphyrinogen oxidase protein [Candidatus Moduliflexus flocculans]|uniref:Probable protoporphyrinogen oxidase protein n=1 Tax=Candidatus Moduliflexus flocculans TaxID=1499966 RepID=A0A081BQ12_9BACT|nr:probable protoporphyrinogen oxidase protein [Candidatus Moduliflexus flocculans]